MSSDGLGGGWLPLEARRDLGVEGEDERLEMLQISSQPVIDIEAVNITDANACIQGGNTLYFRCSE